MRIHRSPERGASSNDLQKDFTGMPLVAQVTTVAFQFTGISLTKCESPLPDSFIRDGDPTLSPARSSTVPKTEREAEIPPDPVTTHFCWETEPFVIGGRNVRFHEAIGAPCSALFPS